MGDLSGKSSGVETVARPLVARVGAVRESVDRSLAGMPAALRMMAGASLSPLADMAGLLVEMAWRIERLEARGCGDGNEK